MTSPSSDLAAIRKRLNRFSCMTSPPDLSSEELEQVRADLRLFNDLSDYQTLGICAGDLATGKTAMESFLKALGVSICLDLPEKDGAVFLKFNTLKGSWYLDDYTGGSRGVLVTFHATEPEVAELIGTYGPFPFDLFNH